MAIHYHKLDPNLLAAQRGLAERGLAGLRGVGALGVVAHEGSTKPPRAIVFLHVDPDDDLVDLDVPELRVNRGRGRVRTALLPMASLEALSESERIHRITSSRPLALRMDVARSKVGVDALLNQTKLTGRDVVVGVVDSGVDTNHPAFQGRIVSLWDQTIDGPGVPEGGYGIELTGGTLSVSRDVNGHGTHVAAIAAGSATPFEGVARETDLVVVKTTMQNAHIADAIRYVFRVATDLDKPAVVNLSLGAHWDAHDGTDDLSLVIDDESGPGRIVCCAAGNEGNDAIHAELDVAPGDTDDVRFVLPPPEGFTSPRVAVLNAWYSGQDRFEVSVVAPDGTSTPFQGVIAPGDPVRTYTLPPGNVTITRR